MPNNFLKKRYKSPNDLRRDHRNFTSHLAKDMQVSFNNFDTDTTLDTVTGIKVDWRHNLEIIRPKGRLTFNSNLLAAGQVKFSNHRLSKNVRQNIVKRLIERHDSAPYVHDKMNGKEYMAYEQACQIYDAVYNILENYRTAKKSAEHFGRPKMLKDHIKDVTASKTDCWKTEIEYHEYDHTKEKYPSQLWDVKYNISWSELRKWIYEIIGESEIKDSLVQSIVHKHKQLLRNASRSTNNTSPIHAALTVALDFESSVQDDLANGPTQSPNIEKDENFDPNYPDYNGTLPPSEAKDVEEDAQAIIKNGVDDHLKEVNAQFKEQGLPEQSVDPDDDQDFDRLRAVQETYDNMKRLDVKCTGSLQKPKDTFQMATNTNLEGVQLDEALDRNNTRLGSNGFRLSRKSWRLPFLGDTDVFHKHPATSAEIITIIDGSGSMGRVFPKTGPKAKPDYYRDRIFPMEQAAEMALAIKKRFPDSHAYIFGDPSGERKNRYDIAGLYPIDGDTFPEFPASGTPLCGALKALEKIHNLDSARIIIGTDGDANWCMGEDAYECVHSVLDSWRNKGIRVATLYTPFYPSEGKVPSSLHGDITVTLEPDTPITNQDIKNVFSFIGG
jgi:hypothetical protein